MLSDVVFIALNFFLTFLEVIRLIYRLIYATAQTIRCRIFPPSRKNVEQKVVVITGAAHGIGRELCKQFVALKANVVAVDVDLENLKRLKFDVESEGHQILIVVCDVSCKEDIQRTYKNVLNVYHTVDILINNAGICYFKPFAKLNVQQLESIFKVNIISHFLTIKAFLPLMIKKKSGHIVAMASVGGWTGMTNITDYCATKSAVIGFMDALRQELSDQNRGFIKLTTISPYFVDTGFWESVNSRLLPILSTEETATHSVDGILKDKFHVFIPGYMEYLISGFWFLPVTCRSILCDFFGIGIKPHVK